MIQKILAFFGFKQKKQPSSIYEFMTNTSKKEKEEFLGRIIEQVNEDQRKVIEKAKLL